MRLTDSKIQWIKNRVNSYCKLLEVEVPTFLILTRKHYEEYKDWRKEINNNYRGRNFSRFWGICHGNCKNERFKMIALNVKQHPNLKSLDQTIRHELIHWSKPSYNHRSVEFYDRMNKLQKGDIKNGRF
jgi:hypothetical protein